MPALPEPYASHLPQLLAAAFAEDLPDLTAPAVFTPDQRMTAVLIAKAAGVLCGVPAFAAAFSFLDPACEVGIERGDGAAVAPGDAIATVAGPAIAVLAAERTGLNSATHLSGVATLTRRFVDAVAGTGCTVLDTRKTTPGLRALEKHAVRCGGGTNHRLGLFDAAMLKDTHIDAAGSLTAAVQRVRARWGMGIRLIVECATLNQVREALAVGAAHIMLDNMDLAMIRQAVAEVSGRARLEASGGVTLATVAAIAATGVDFVSVGALTHSAPVLDLSLKERP
ncbi:MAG: carboxylating nicotinate-nucleotide diphosphorylase [Acidobacteria bacterium]|nr:carboxylating nicotinate-nucleotide diphosphorylase [Acidobacteriota bacterium]